MKLDLGRRGVLATLSAAVTIPLINGSAEAAIHSTAGSSAGPDDIDFATWNRINNLVHIYADCIDRLDLDGLVEIFMVDGVFDYAPGKASRGREAIKAAGVKTLSKFARTWHNMSSPTVTRGAQPDTFDAITYFAARHGHKDGSYHAVYGRYLDHYVRDKETQKLLIANRKLVAQMSEGDAGERYWLSRLS